MSYAQQPWRLSESTGLTAGPEIIIEALRAQAARFAGTLLDVSPHEWNAPSRCTGWSVGDVARHVVDVAEFSRDQLAGRPGRLAKFGPFSLATTPGRWLEDSNGQSPERTVENFLRVTSDVSGLLAAQAADDSHRLRHGPLGRPVHWSLLPLHVFWDMWMHERDIAVPLQREIQAGVSEVRLTVLYGLLIAAQPSALQGDPLDATFALSGSPDGRYRVGGGAEDVSVAAGEGSLRVVHGDMYTVMDGLTGRGKKLPELFAPPAPRISAQIASGLGALGSVVLPEDGSRSWFAPA